MTARRLSLAGAVMLLASCRAATDPSRENAQWLLTAATASRAAQTCVLESFLAGKPEFASLRAERFCEPHVVVTAIREISANERVVEYDLVRTWKRPAIEQWTAAFGKLEARLRALQPERRLEKPAVGPPATRFVWIDPSDRQTFTATRGGDLLTSPAAPPSITASAEWHPFQESEDFTIEITRRWRDSAESFEAMLRRAGSGWEVTVPARAHSQQPQ